MGAINAFLTSPFTLIAVFIGIVFGLAVIFDEVGR